MASSGGAALSGGGGGPTTSHGGRSHRQSIARGLRGGQEGGPVARGSRPGRQAGPGNGQAFGHGDGRPVPGSPRRGPRSDRSCHRRSMNEETNFATPRMAAMRVTSVSGQVRKCRARGSSQMRSPSGRDDSSARKSAFCSAVRLAYPSRTRLGSRRAGMPRNSMSAELATRCACTAHQRDRCRRRWRGCSCWLLADRPEVPLERRAPGVP